MTRSEHEVMGDIVRDTAYLNAAGEVETDELNRTREVARKAGLTERLVNWLTRRGKNEHLIDEVGDFEAARHSDIIYDSGVPGENT